MNGNPATAARRPSPEEGRSFLRRAAWPLLVAAVYAGWLLLMAAGGKWRLFLDAWFMTATMVAGSFIAGATCQGGGAVAFPVMTIVFGIEPAVARDFNLMIQSVGMTSAACVILSTGITVERRSILLAGLGGAAGVVMSLSWVAPLAHPAYVKIFFTSLWLSLGVMLYLLNRHEHSGVFDRILRFGPRHGWMLVLAGWVGGVVSGLTGVGLDSVAFALLVLYFRVNEKIATPTSVVLMAAISLVGFAWKAAVGGGMLAEAWDYWYVCVPVVVVGAPLGALYIRALPRLLLVKLICVTIVVQYFGALWVVPQTPALLLFGLATVAAGVAACLVMNRLGLRRLRTAAHGSQT
ncbi:MAG: sulfite exporter TauE/SafE family protein [Elusimicrobiota bacterium]